MPENNKNSEIKPKKKRKLLIPQENRSFAREVIEIIVLTLILIIGIKNLIGEPRWIPTESMVPTLIEGDRVFIEKISTYTKDINRGDVIVFYPPEVILHHDPWSEFTRALGFLNNDVAYIKRLIGMPGDTIEVVEGVGVFVNGTLINEPYVNEIANRGCGTRLPFCGPLKLAEDEYFLMGDNRNNSLDSRAWGPLLKKRVIGKSFCTWWPINRISLTEHPDYDNLKTKANK